MQPITLLFDKETERAFLEAVFDRDAAFIRRLVAVVGVAMATICVARAALGDLGIGRLIELSVVGLCGLAYDLCRRKVARRHPVLTTVAMLLVIFGALVMAMITAQPERRPYVNGLIYVFMMVTMIVPLQIPSRVACLALAYGFAAYHALSNTIYPAGTGHLPLLHQTLAFVLALGGSYLLESGNRKRFLLECEVQAEKRRADNLLRNVLPHSVAERLLASPESGSVVQRFNDVAVLFADIVGFTALAASRPPEEIVRLLDSLFSRFDLLAARHGVEKIKTIGDAYMAVAGVPETVADPCERIVALALDMRDAVARYTRLTGESLAIRIGVHCGPVVAGIIGRQRLVYDLWGDTVNIAAKLETAGTAGRIHVSAAIAARLPSAFAVEDRGVVMLKGKGEYATAFVRAAGEETDKSPSCAAVDDDRHSA